VNAFIRYFSGTGNSWRIAKTCAGVFEAAGYRTDIGGVTWAGMPDQAPDATVFCFPIHSLDLPRVARRYLEGLPIPPVPVPSLILVTGGDPDDCGWSIESGVRILAGRGYPVQIGEMVQMPDNWTPFHSTEMPELSAAITAAGVAMAGELSRAYLSGERRIKPVNLKKFGPVGSFLLRNLYHRRGISQLWRFFQAGERCDGCGFCARACPTGSITMRAGKPVWSQGCEQCMRCFNYCPRRAVFQLDWLFHGSRHNAHRLPGFRPLEDTPANAGTAT
jgi:ferredoxin